jgi:thiol-disulfide isomerase/thioredoxin
MDKKTILGIFSLIVIIAGVVALGYFLPAKSEQISTPSNSSNTSSAESTGTIQKGTFTETSKEICRQGGKPIIRLFSTTWCPHCQWIKDDFDSVVKEYVDKGKIVAYHWQLDAGDDTLTAEVEKKVPAGEEAIFEEFNPDQSIPTFVFGCKYYRIGNGYEREGDHDKEKAEFRKIIDELIKEK